MTKIFTKKLPDGTILMGEVSSGANPIQVDAVLYSTGWLEPNWKAWPLHLQEQVKRAIDAAEREHQVGFTIVECRCEPDWDAPGAVEGLPSRYSLHIVALSQILVHH